MVPPHRIEVVLIKGRNKSCANVLPRHVSHWYLLGNLRAGVIVVVDRNAAEVLAAVFVFQVQVLEDGVFEKVVPFEAFADLAYFLRLRTWYVESI